MGLSEAEELELLELEDQEVSDSGGYGGGDVTENPLDEISFADRLRVKVAGTPDASLEFLRKQYPQLQIKRNNDRIIGKTPGEENWRTLDPNQGFKEFFSKETAKDVAEALPEFLTSGAAQFGGEVAGATGGAALGAMTGPLAPYAVPTLAYGGKVLGGATGSGISEAARQLLGKYLDVNKEINTQDVSDSALSGGITSALFSSQLPGATKASRGILKDNLVKGAPYAAYDAVKKKVGPAFSEFLSGIPAPAIRNYQGKFYDAVKELDKRTDFSGTLDTIRKGFKKSVQDPMTKIGEKMSAITSLIDDKTKKATGESLDAATDNAFAAVGELEQRLNLLKSKKAGKIAEMLGTTKAAVKDEKKLLKENLKLLKSSAKNLDELSKNPSSGLISKDELLAPINAYKQATLEKYGGPQGVAGTDIPEHFAELDKMARDAFGDESTISLQKAMQVKQKIKEFAKITKEGGTQTPKTTRDAMNVNAWNDVINNIDSSIDNIADKYNLPNLKDLRKDYSDLADTRRIIKDFEDKDSLDVYRRLLKDPDTVGRIEQADKIAKKYGSSKMKNQAEFMSTYAHLGEPSVGKISKEKTLLRNILTPSLGVGGAFAASKLQNEADIPWWVTVPIGSIAGHSFGSKFGTLKGIKKTYGREKGLYENMLKKYASPVTMGIKGLLRDVEKGDDNDIGVYEKLLRQQEDNYGRLLDGSEDY